MIDNSVDDIFDSSYIGSTLSIHSRKPKAWQQEVYHCHTSIITSMTAKGFQTMPYTYCTPLLYVEVDANHLCACVP